MISVRRLLIATALVLAVAASSCRADPEAELDPDPALVAELEDLDTPFHLPRLAELRGYEVDDVRVEQGAARMDLLRDGRPGVVLLELPWGGRALCRELADVRMSGSGCRNEGDDMVSDFEEMTSVAVRRGDTVLVLTGLVTEADPELVEDALELLRSAPEASAEELAALAA